MIGAGDAADWEVDLASEADFRLGRLLVQPSAARVEADGRTQRVAPQVMRVLVVFARRAGETVTRDQLVAACWGGRVVSDDAVNRVIAQVRALARAFAPPPFELETVSKVGFRLEVEDSPGAPMGAAGFAPAGRRGLGRVWVFGAFAGVILAVGLGLWALRGAVQPARDRDGRVEVVRFEIRGNDPELQRLSADVDESLVRTLSRSSIDTVRRLPGRDAAAELRVGGSIQRDGDEVIINTQILDRRSGLVLLSIRLARKTGAMGGFAEQDGVGVAAVLNCMLEDRRQSHRQLSPQTLALYLNTCDAIARESNPQRMIEQARRLTQAQPDLAVGQALLAVAQASLARETPSEEEAATLRQEARATAARALALDPATPKAHLALAISYPAGTAYAERERHLRRAREIDPNLNPGRMEYVGLLRELGRLKEARTLVRQMLDSGDPRTSVHVLSPAAALAAQVGDLAGAEALAGEAERHSPGFGESLRRQTDLWWTPPATAVARWRERAANPEASPMTRCAAAYVGRLAAGAAGRGLPALCDKAPVEARIRMLAREGDVEGAYAALNGSREWRANPAILSYPELAGVRADRRFLAVAQSVGLSAYWRTSGQWPDFCAEQTLPYDCRDMPVS